MPGTEYRLHVLLWAALFRNWDIGDWLKLAELSWKPWRIGSYKGSASTEDIQGLINALESLTSNGVATHSDRVEIGVEWPQRGRGGKPEHEALASFIGMEMSKAVLGQTLTTEQGERGAQLERGGQRLLLGAVVQVPRQTIAFLGYRDLLAVPQQAF